MNSLRLKTRDFVYVFIVVIKCDSIICLPFYDILILIFVQFFNIFEDNSQKY